MTEYETELKIREWLRRLVAKTGYIKLILFIFFALLLCVFIYVPWYMTYDNGAINSTLFVRYSFVWDNNRLLKIDFDRIIIEVLIIFSLLGIFLTVFWNKRPPAKTVSLRSLKMLAKNAPEKLKELYDLQDLYKKAEVEALKKGVDIETFLKEKGLNDEAIKHFLGVISVPRLKL